MIHKNSTEIPAVNVAENNQMGSDDQVAADGVDNKPKTPEEFPSLSNRSGLSRGMRLSSA